MADRAAPGPGDERAIAVLLFKDNAGTCPDVLNTVRCWAAHGRRVDLLVFDTGLYPLPSFREARARLVAVRTIYGRLLPLVRRLRGDDNAVGTASGAPPSGTAPVAARPGPLRRLFALGVGAIRALQTLEFFVAHTLRLLRGGYALAIACDLPSLLAARAARALRGTPFVYHSRELALSWDQRSPGARIAKHAERLCHRAAMLTVVQDTRRAELLARDNRVPQLSFLLVPNSPIGTGEGATSDFLGSRLGLPATTPIVLHAGSVLPETMVLEIIESIAGWPAEAALVVHGVAETGYRPVLDAAAARHPGRVYFSSSLVAAADVDRLFASAAVGLALYRPIDDNFRFVGCAAGKIFNLMKVGIPIVTNDLPGMRELIEESGCGRVVRNPAELGAAIADLLARRAPCRARCAETFPRYEFSRNYRAVIDRAEAAIRR